MSRPGAGAAGLDGSPPGASGLSTLTPMRIIMLGWGQNIIVQQIVDLETARKISKILHEMDPEIRNIVVSGSIFRKIRSALKIDTGPFYLNGIRFWQDSGLGPARGDQESFVYKDHKL